MERYSYTKLVPDVGKVETRLKDASQLLLPLLKRRLSTAILFAIALLLTVYVFLRTGVSSGGELPAIDVLQFVDPLIGTYGPGQFIDQTIRAHAAEHNQDMYLAAQAFHMRWSSPLQTPLRTIAAGSRPTGIWSAGSLTCTTLALVV